MAKSYRDGRSKFDYDEMEEFSSKARREQDRQEKRKNKISETNKVFDEKSEDE